MTKTLITRISNLKQYDERNKSILWKDDSIKNQKRWTREGVYGKIDIGDNIILIIEKSQKEAVFIGKISNINKDKKQIECNNIEEFNCTNDQFLSLHNIYPEHIRQVKANFPPFIHPDSINVEQIKQDIKNKQFVKFYIIKKSEYNNHIKNFHNNDRIIFINDNEKIDEAKIYIQDKSINELEDIHNISVKGLQLKQILEINQKTNKPNNIKRIKEVIQHITNEGYYEFKTFFSYHDALINERTYGNSNTYTIRDTNTNNIKETKHLISNDSQSLNQILYGPPGTGKTYNTIIKAMEIINKTKYENVSEQEYYKLKEEFEKLREKGQIAFITFHQSYSYEEFVEGIKPSINDNDENVDVKYGYNVGIFKEIANNALFECLNITKEQKQQDIEFDNILEQFKIKYPNGTDLNTIEKSNFKIVDYIQNSIRIQPKSGSNIYSISFMPLKEMYEKDKIENIKTPSELGKKMKGRFSGLTSYYFSVLKEIRKFDGIKITENDYTTNNNVKIEEYYSGKLELKKEGTLPHVLIIDEINRGNISKIFGELITLIEHDKRIGNTHQLKTILPYTKNIFGVPNNLYIIGTMNTSDRSIASVDIALRRRFKFIEIPPKKELVTAINIKGTNFQDIFEALNEKITILLDCDHQIGHSYFMRDRVGDNIQVLKDIWFDEILPLLNEYFYNDWEKLQVLLGKASDKNSFIIKKDCSKKYKNSFKDIMDEDEMCCYNFVVKEQMEDDSFKIALSNIIEKTEKEQ